MKNRAKIAAYAAKSLVDNDIPRDELVTQLAAWLKDTKQSRSAKYLVEDIAKKLVDSNYVYVSVTTAHAISEDTRKAILNFLRQHFGSDAVFELNEVVEPRVIGGVRIDTPSGSIDSTIKRKLIHIIKGVQR